MLSQERYVVDLVGVDKPSMKGQFGGRGLSGTRENLLEGWKQRSRVVGQLKGLGKGTVLVPGWCAGRAVVAGGR